MKNFTKSFLLVSIFALSLLLSVQNASAATGTITSSSSCSIAIFTDLCDVGVTWSTSGATSPIIKQDGIQFSTSANQATPVQRAISGGTGLTSVPPGSHTFEVYDGTTLLASSTSTSSCSQSLGYAVWFGGNCVVQGLNISLWPSVSPYSPLLASSSTSGNGICYIPLNGSSCNINVSWNSSQSGSVTSPAMKLDGNTFSTSNTSVWPGMTQTLSYGSHSFGLYSASNLLVSKNAQAVCTTGTSWNGTVCATSSLGNGIIVSYSSCIIPLNSVNCGVSVSWSGYDTTSPNIKKDGTTISTNENDNSLEYISYGNHTFIYNDGSDFLDSTTATASCVSGSVWNGQRCVSGSISSTPTCNIPANGTSCTVGVTWTTSSYVTGPLIKERNSDAVNSSILSSGVANQSSQVTSSLISYGEAHYFSLFDTYSVSNSPITRLDVSASKAVCISGTAWNGIVCANINATGNITSTSTCSINSGAFCNVGVTWSSSNLTAPIIKQDGIQFSTSANQVTPVQKAISGNGVSGIPPGNHVFTVYDGPTLIASSTSTASCNASSVWWGQPPTPGCVNQGLNISLWPSVSPYTPVLSSPGNSTCYIPVNGSSCTMKVSWNNGGNPSPVMRLDSTTFSTAGVSVWPGVTQTLSYGNHVFNLYSSSSLLTSKNAYAVCMQGTSWDGTICATGSTGNGIITSDSTCTINLNSSSCSVDVAWSGIGITSPDIKKDGNTISTIDYDTVTENISYGNHTFSFYDGSDLIDASMSTGACISGSTWNGIKCVSASISSTPSCSIAVNASSCNVSVTWSSTGLTSPLVIGQFSSGNQSISSNVANQSTPMSVAIPYGNSYFHINDVVSNSLILLDTVPVSGVCASNSLWDGVKCSLSSITATSSCFIATYNGSCPVNVSWVGVGLTSPDIKQDSTTISTTSSNPYPGSSFNISEGSHTFTLNDGSTLLDSATSVASCDVSDEWDGTACSPSTSNDSARVSLNATSNTTTIKKPVVLTWSAPSSAYCEGNGFDTGSLTSGSVVVNPKATTTYSVDCFDANGVKLSDTEKIAIGKLKLTYSIGAPVADIVLPTCPAGSTWDPTTSSCSSLSKASLSIFQTTSDTYPEPYKCMIPADGKACDVLVAWSSRDVSKLSVKQDGVQFSGLSVNLGGVKRPVGFGTTFFTIYQGSLLLDTVPVEAGCISGAWDGTSCNPNFNPTNITVVTNDGTGERTIVLPPQPQQLSGRPKCQLRPNGTCIGIPAPGCICDVNRDNTLGNPPKFDRTMNPGSTTDPVSENITVVTNDGTGERTIVLPPQPQELSPRPQCKRRANGTCIGIPSPGCICDVNQDNTTQSNPAGRVMSPSSTTTEPTAIIQISSLIAGSSTDASTCTIPSGSSTCKVNVSWSTDNVTSPSVKQNGTAFSSMADNTTGSTRSIKYGTTYFTVYQGSTLLNYYTAEASCASGTWDGAICNPNFNSNTTVVIDDGTGERTIVFIPQPQQLSARPKCLLDAHNKCIGIPAPGCICDVNRDDTSTNNNPKVTDRMMSPGSTTNPVTANRPGWCPPMCGWNDTLGVCDCEGDLNPPKDSVSLAPSSTDPVSSIKISSSSSTDSSACTIPSGSSTCKVNVSWSTDNVTSPNIKQNGTAFSSIADSIIGVVRSIGQGITYFTAYQGSTILNVFPVQATCASGNWDGATCNPNFNPEPQQSARPACKRRADNSCIGIPAPGCICDVNQDNTSGKDPKATP